MGAPRAGGGSGSLALRSGVGTGRRPRKGSRVQTQRWATHMPGGDVGGPSAHDAELRLRPHPPPAEDAPRMRTGASVNSPGAGGRRAGEWGLEGQAGTAMPPRVTAFQELWAVENPGLWPVEAQKEATCGHPTPPSRRLLVAGIS